MTRWDIADDNVTYDVREIEYIWINKRVALSCPSGASGSVDACLFASDYSVPVVPVSRCCPVTVSTPTYIRECAAKISLLQAKSARHEAPC